MVVRREGETDRSASGRADGAVEEVLYDEAMALDVAVLLRYDE